MKQEFRLYKTECVKISFPEQRRSLYFSSFNKAGAFLKVSGSCLITSFKNDNGWRILDKQPIKINVIDIDESIKCLVDAIQS